MVSQPHGVRATNTSQEFIPPTVCGRSLAPCRMHACSPALANTWCFDSCVADSHLLLQPMRNLCLTVGWRKRPYLQSTVLQHAKHCAATTQHHSSTYHARGVSHPEATGAQEHKAKPQSSIDHHISRVCMRRLGRQEQCGTQPATHNNGIDAD